MKIPLGRFIFKTSLLKVRCETDPEEGYLPTAQPRPRKRGFAEQFLDQSQACGEFIVSVDQLAQAGQMRHVAVRRQLEHLSQRVQHLLGRPPGTSSCLPSV